MGAKAVADSEVVEQACDDEVGVTDESVVAADTDDEPTDPKGPAHTARWWWPVARPTSRGLRHWGRLAARGAAVLVFLAALGGAGYEGWLLYQQHQRQVAAYQALDAARKFAVDFTNADPATIDAAIGAITEGSTGEFKTRYVRSISQLRAMLIENKVTTRGTVVRSAIESVTDTRVEVLMFVKESFTSAAVPQAPPAPQGPPAPQAPPAPESPPPPATAVVGMAITLEKVDGRWLVSRIVPGDKL